MTSPNAVRYRIAAIVLTAAAGASCRTAAITEARPAIVQPGAPGEPSRVIAAAQASDLSRVQYTGADIKFMQGMIGHHAQAVDMVALVPSRSSSDDVRKLALRIDVSQQDEMKMMQGWLVARAQRLPDPKAHHMMGAALMPGMLTPEEMVHLAAATGVDFTIYSDAGSQLGTVNITTNIPTASGREVGVGGVYTCAATVATDLINLDYMAWSVPGRVLTRGALT